jgi:uncharacterized protein YjlB
MVLPDAESAQVIRQLVEDDGIYPNNGRLPLLVYPSVLVLSGRDPAAKFEELFRENNWGGSWRNGVYGFHHYHSTAHEVLGIYGGVAEVQFGGQQGPVFSVAAGDVVVIPAGVAHKNLGSSADFRVVGAYPLGQRPDLNRGVAGERPDADIRIARLPLPLADPVHGRAGPLLTYWKGVP